MLEPKMWSKIYGNNKQRTKYDFNLDFNYFIYKFNFNYFKNELFFNEIFIYNINTKELYIKGVKTLRKESAKFNCYKWYNDWEKTNLNNRISTNSKLGILYASSRISPKKSIASKTKSVNKNSIP